MIAEYLSQLTARLEDQLGDRLVAAWVVGSSALGDFDEQRSDVDVQAVTSIRLSRAELEQLAGALSHESLPCPVRGLEFVLYAQEDLTDPKGPAFSLNLNTGPRMDHHAGYDPEAEPRFWFTLDVSIASQQSRRLAGAPAETVLPPLPRELVIEAAKEALEFWRGYDSGQAILSACRAGHGRSTVAGCQKARRRPGRRRASRIPPRWPRRSPGAPIRTRPSRPPPSSRR